MTTKNVILLHNFKACLGLRKGCPCFKGGESNMQVHALWKLGTILLLCASLKNFIVNKVYDSWRIYRHQDSHEWSPRFTIHYVRNTCRTDSVEWFFIFFQNYSLDRDIYNISYGKDKDISLSSWKCWGI